VKCEDGYMVYASPTVSFAKKSSLYYREEKEKGMVPLLLFSAGMATFS